MGFLWCFLVAAGMLFWYYFVLGFVSKKVFFATSHLLAHFYTFIILQMEKLKSRK